VKRALNYLHTSMAAADRVAQKNLLPPARLGAFRAELCEVREKILELMQRFAPNGSRKSGVWLYPRRSLALPRHYYASLERATTSR
jgi:hypothetical protein